VLVEDFGLIKRPFTHGAYHYTLAVARLCDDPPAYHVSLDRSSSDRSETARVTDKQYALPGSPQRYAPFCEKVVTSRLVDYLQELIEGGHPLPDELPADWYRHADEP
jgi:hypothetical protein